MYKEQNEVSMETVISDKNIWYYQDINSKVAGPFSTQWMIKLYNNLEITPESLVRSNLMNHWISLSDSLLASQQFRHLRNDSIHKRTGSMLRNSFIAYHLFAPKNIKKFTKENPRSLKQNHPLENPPADTFDIGQNTQQGVKITESKYQRCKEVSLRNGKELIKVSISDIELKEIENKVTMELAIYFSVSAFLLKRTAGKLPVEVVIMLLISGAIVFYYAHKHRVEKEIDITLADKLDELVKLAINKEKSHIEELEKEKTLKRKQLEDRARERIALEQENDRQKLRETARIDAVQRSKNVIQEMSIKTNNKYAFYIMHDPRDKNAPTKLGISNDPQRRCIEHKKQTNINFEVYKTFWLQNKEKAIRIEQQIIKTLHRRGCKRVGNEFFSVTPETISDLFLKLAT